MMNFNPTSHLERKAAQLSFIEKNIHIIEGIRNKLGWTYSDMVHAFDLMSDELAQVYSRYYPSCVVQSQVNTNKNHRKYLMHTLLKETTIDSETVGFIMNQTKIFQFCVTHGIWPANRVNRTSSINSDPSRKNIELTGNKTEIKTAIGKLRRYILAAIETNPSFDKIVYIGEQIKSEESFHIKIKQSIANAYSNIIVSNDPENHLKLKDSMSDLKTENERHQYALKELLAMMDKEQSKEFDDEVPKGIDKKEDVCQDEELFVLDDERNSE